MTQITIDAEAAGKLRELCSSAQVVDDEGRILGLFTPAETKRFVNEPEIDYRELREEMDHETARPLADILRGLGAD